MSNPYKIWYTNPGGEEFSVKAFSGTLTRPQIKDRLDPRTLEMEVPRDVAIRQFARIRVSKHDKPYLQAYVKEQPEISSSKKTVRAVGLEDLLITCPGVPCFYKKESITFEELFTDVISETSPRQRPGLLGVANSVFPVGTPYTIYDADTNIDQISGAGTDSRIGTYPIYVCGYDGIRRLTQCASLAELAYTDTGYYASTTDLYVRIDDGNYDWGWRDLGGLLIYNAFDTYIRLGEIVSGALKLRGDLSLKITSKIGDLMIGLTRGHDLWPRFRDSRTYLYFDIDDEQGDEAVDELDESVPGHITDLKRAAASDCRVHALTATGEGNQHISEVDFSQQGLFIRGFAEFAGGFKDAKGILTKFAEAEYDDRQADYIWKVTTPRSLTIKPGDSITLKPLHEAAETLPAAKIREELDGSEMVIELGNASPGQQDGWDVLQGISDDYTDSYIEEKHEARTATCTFRIFDATHDNTDRGDLEFKIPKGVLDEKLLSRIVLELSMNVLREDSETNESQVDLGPCALLVFCGTTLATAPAVSYGAIVGYTPGQAILSMDITDFVTADATNHVGLQVVMNGDVEDDDESDPHTSVAEHPLISASGTVRILSRRE